ncbi:MAG: sigma-70 family RNA polymerase sigma factor [Verrucomicrobiaceae bacterium]|nr:sigma-70 family RNA polymerase sigma factor [Verrucomicrobiaceae bacterium]
MNSTTTHPLNADSDACGAWFAQALRGDSDAATRLYACCVPSVRNWLSRSVPSEMAEDYAHEAMVMAFRRAEQFRPGTSFVCWVRTMAWRIALNALRADLRRKTRETAFFEQNDAETDFRDEAVFAALERCVAELPGEQRQLIRLRFQLDQSAGEIAASLGRSRVAVAVSLHRICKRLRSGLEQHTRL